MMAPVSITRIEWTGELIVKENILFIGSKKKNSKNDKLVWLNQVSLWTMECNLWFLVCRKSTFCCCRAVFLCKHDMMYDCMGWTSHQSSVCNKWDRPVEEWIQRLVNKKNQTFSSSIIESSVVDACCLFCVCDLIVDMKSENAERSLSCGCLQSSCPAVAIFSAVQSNLRIDSKCSIVLLSRVERNCAKLGTPWGWTERERLIQIPTIGPSKKVKLNESSRWSE